MISFFTLSAAIASEAATAPAAASAPGNMTRVVIQLVALVVIFYLFFIRPQQRKTQEHMQMISNLKVGDEVLVGGFIGKVSEIISEGEVAVELDKNVHVKVLRSFITQVIIEKSTETVKKEKE